MQLNYQRISSWGYLNVCLSNMTGMTCREVSTIPARREKIVNGCFSEQFHEAKFQPSPEIQANFLRLAIDQDLKVVLESYSECRAKGFLAEILLACHCIVVWEHSFHRLRQIALKYRRPFDANKTILYISKDTKFKCTASILFTSKIRGVEHITNKSASV